MEMRVVCFMFYLLNCAFAQRSPSISYITQTQIKDVGDDVDLACAAQDSHDFAIIWMKVDRQSDISFPISSGSSLILMDSRYSLDYNPAKSLYRLQIKDIRETDAGLYTCQILPTPSTRISADVELLVRRRPVIFDNSTSSVLAVEGEAVKLECYAGGYPSPTISWRRENNDILPTGGAVFKGNVLEIPKISKDHRGTYFCVAENGVGRAIKRSVAVQIEMAPIVTVPRPRVGQAPQYDAILECNVEAYPPPVITWEKDGVTLTNGQHYTLSHFATADEFADTILRVLTVEKGQYGEYVCRAANKLGKAEGKIELFETTIPVCPPACGLAKEVTEANEANEVSTTTSTDTTEVPTTTEAE